MGYSELPADIRARHPFHMYDEIKAQPEAISRSLALAADRLDDLAGIISRARRVYLTGCGTSFHAAQVGAWMLNGFSRGSVDAHAVQAFELVTYTRDLGSRDVVVALSHSGATHMTNRALERANQIGAATIAVTGFPEKASGKLARFTLPTGYPDERSWAHTVSYTAALTSLAAVANHLAHPDERVDLSPLPGVVADVLGLEEVVHNTAAAALRDRDRSGGVPIMLIGAGPNAATASEGVLKLLETSYCAALAFELEQALHGPLAALDTDSVVMIIAPPGKSQERAVSLAAAVRCIGPTPMVITGAAAGDAFPDAHRLILPDIPELLSPIPYVVPLQLFSYFMAVGSSRNPDLIHRDDERYRMAAGAYQ